MLEFLNCNKAAEMTQILENAQRLYVPTGEVDGEQNVLEKVVFDGDQLTEERARNAQWANAVADTQFDRLEGLEPTFGEWHLKRNLFQVIILLVTFCPNKKDQSYKLVHLAKTLIGCSAIRHNNSGVRTQRHHHTSSAVISLHHV